MASAHVAVSSAEVARLASSDAALRILRRTAEDVRTAAVRRCPVDTGDLRASLAVEMVVGGARPVARVGSRLAYALYVHEGHGVIVPRRSFFLRWPNVNNRYVQTGGNRRYSGGKTASYIYARRVGPVKGRPFLREGAADVLGPQNVRTAV